ncbi:MAG: hypothetical protein AB7I27_12725 [Bacteriovoracaceae bacterium]
MKTKNFSFAMLLALSFYAHSNPALAWEKDCEKAVTEFVKHHVKNAESAQVIYLYYHHSITQGTYNQTFISLLQIDEKLYSMVTHGDYDCDDLSLFNLQEIPTGLVYE